MTIPVFFPTPSPSSVAALRRVDEPACEMTPRLRDSAARLASCVERERVRQKALTMLALEALGRGDTDTVKRCIAKFDTP